MRKISKHADAVVVDARFQKDYSAGHIEGAISLPVNCTDQEYTQTTSKLPRNKPIVLYCQSKNCKFAEIIAISLREDGFRELSVFKGGWIEWQQAGESQSVKQAAGKHEKEDIS